MSPDEIFDYLYKNSTYWKPYTVLKDILTAPEYNPNLQDQGNAIWELIFVNSNDIDLIHYVLSDSRIDISQTNVDSLLNSTIKKHDKSLFDRIIKFLSRYHSQDLKMFVENIPEGYDSVIALRALFDTTHPLHDIYLSDMKDYNREIMDLLNSIKSEDEREKAFDIFYDPENPYHDNYSKYVKQRIGAYIDPKVKKGLDLLDTNTLANELMFYDIL